MRKLLPVIPALLALSYSPAASALGRGVLWYEAASYGTTMNSTQLAALLAAGATSFTDTTSWPSSLSGYRVIFVVMPTSSMSSAQISDLNNFTASGGIVVLVGEAAGYYSPGGTILNSIASGMGLSSSFTSNSLDSGCSWTATRQSTTAVLTASTSSLIYAYGTNITRGASATTLYSYSNTTLVVREGHTLLVSDGGIFYSTCAGISNNSTFTTAIYNWSCDYDEDLAQSVDCGGADLDDTNASIGSTRTWYADTDGDGYGNASVTTTATSQPSGYVSNSTDCNDTSAAINPGATEVCDSSNTDEDCDGTADDSDSAATGKTTWYADTDGDGYGGTTSLTRCDQPSGYVSNQSDCNDTNNQRYPGATETCNGADDDCDGSTDESSAVDAVTWYQDLDSDTYGNAAVSQVACSQPSGYVRTTGDCNDQSAGSNPGATEVCNSADDDCDGAIDEADASNATTWYADADGDGYGNINVPVRACTQPSGYVSWNSDCDDTAASTYPNATEYCDGIDNNCDLQIDENGAADVLTWYADADGDGYGNASATQSSCNQPSGYVRQANDCNDSDAGANPAAAETCDGDDNNCNGTVDENSAVDARTWYADSDGDGFGDPATPQVACNQPSAYVSQNLDCNDSDADANPGATEYCDGDDDNCNGVVDEDSAADALTWYDDSDGDGYGDPASSSLACSQPSDSVSDNTDCDDSAADSNPAGLEVCDGLDNNCDGLVDEESAANATQWYADADADGFGDAGAVLTRCEAPAGYVAIPGDCNDSDATLSPSATEVCDGLDNDCDGSIDDADSSLVGAIPWYYDADQDGVGDTGTSVIQCTAPADFVADPGDCDDEDATVSPRLPEQCDAGNVDENCNGLSDDADASVDSAGYSTWYSDADADGYGDSSRAVLLCDAPAGTVGVDGDCDDSNAAFNPAAAESCDDPTDYNCDGSVGFADLDGDGWAACEECDDSSATVRPDASELCNGLDDNCDTVIDLDAVDASTWYVDEDGDGQGNEDKPVLACTAAEGTVGNKDDCNDSDATIYLGAPEIAGDEIDQDCDGKDLEEPTGSSDSGDSGDSNEPGDSVPTGDSGDSANDSGKNPGDTCGCNGSGAEGLGLAGMGLLGLLGARRRRS